MNRNAALALGIAAVLAETAIWHGPLGAGERLAATAEGAARAELERQEMTGIRAKLERDPLLSRRMTLSGPADDFQQSELARLIDAKPGVAGVRWATPPSGSEGVK